MGINRRGFLGAIAAVAAPKPKVVEYMANTTLHVQPATTPGRVFGVAAATVQKGDVVEIVTQGPVSVRGSRLT